MLSPKIILLFTLSVLNISVHSQNTPPPPAPPDTTKMKDTGFVVWKKYLEQNINPNTPANYGAPAGIYNVYVQFIIARDGTISDVKALTTFGYGMEAEVVRALKKWSPWGDKWKPADQTIRNTMNTYKKQPFTFIVPAIGFNISTKVPYVLFTGIDNEITVEVEKVKTRDVKLIMPEGTITPAGDGKYIVRVNKPGSVIIELYKKKKKKKRKIGAASFEVRDGKNI